MSGITNKSFDAADETRTPEKTRVDIVRLSDTEVARMIFEPGWRWSECIKPLLGTASCELEHVGYAAQGQLTVVHDDGTKATISAGEAYRIAPGHDAWVEGPEPFIGLEFNSAAEYAKV
jgi:hypothetical protein